MGKEPRTTSSEAGRGTLLCFSLAEKRQFYLKVTPKEKRRLS